MCDGCHAHPLDVLPPCPAEPLTGDEQETLESLIASQERDAADDHAPRHRREVNATDMDGRVSVRQGRREPGGMGIGWQVLKRAVDHRCHPSAWQSAMHQAIDEQASAAVRSGGENRAGRAASPTIPLVLVGMSRPWDSAEAQYVPTAGQPCPGCNDGRMPAAWMCAVCSSTAQDPRRWPAQAQEATHRKVKRAKVKPAGKAGVKGKAVKVS